MQLDKTHVVIRVRTLSEVGDLALVMLRRYPSALLVGFALGALPWIIMNAALLSWIPYFETEYDFLNDDESFAEIARYCSWMCLLVFLQAPAAGVLTTIYLGQAVFEQKPTWSSVIAEARRQFGRWFYVLGVKRLAIPVMIVLALRWDTPADGFFDVLLPIIVVLIAALVRASRPFLPEILLLEQCPLRDPTNRVITAPRRSKSLHTPMGSELSGRFIAISLILFWLFASVLYTMFAARELLAGTRTLDAFFFILFFPAALWIIAGASVLVRLLNYLDARIRLEGWEVELAVRAEAIRQFGEEPTSRRNTEAVKSDRSTASNDAESTTSPTAQEAAAKEVAAQHAGVRR